MTTHAHAVPEVLMPEPVVEKPHKVKHLTGEERVDALCAFLNQHGIHVPEEIAAKE